MTRPTDYQLIVPEGWRRIDLQPGVREPALARMVERQFRGADAAGRLPSPPRFLPTTVPTPWEMWPGAIN
jgi:hypothetical protein